MADMILSREHAPIRFGVAGTRLGGRARWRHGHGGCRHAVSQRSGVSPRAGSGHLSNTPTGCAYARVMPYNGAMETHAEPDGTGPLSAFLARDHRRLEALLDAAMADPSAPDLNLYGQFREGLLRHIGMEEKILLRMAKDALGTPVPQADVLRKDHGDITSLLVPSPTPDTVALLRHILEGHNRLEEGPDGVYAACERILEGHHEEVMARLTAAGPVPLMPLNDHPRALSIVARIRAQRLGT